MRMTDVGCKLGFEMRMMCKTFGVRVCVALFGACASAVFAADPADARAEFQKALDRIDGSREELNAELQGAYLRRLREIQSELETQGLVRNAVAVFDEISRTTKTKTLPTVPAPDPVEMRDVQLAAIAKWQQISYSNEHEVVNLAGRYLQFLAQSGKGSPEVDSERERVLLLPRLRAALKATSGNAPDPAALYGTATNANGELKFRPLKLATGSGEELAARLNYDLQASMAEDDSKLRTRKTSSALSTTLGEDGLAIYRTRFSVGARSESLPAGCRLVVTYFSRSLVEKERRRENTELIPLPPLAKGESYTADGQGLSVGRSYATTQSTRGYASISSAGSEWYGMVIELQSPDGRTILQRFSPQSLERELLRDEAKNSVR